MNLFGYMQKRFNYEDFAALGKTAKSVGIEIIPSILLIDDIKSYQVVIYSSILKLLRIMKKSMTCFIVFAVSEPLESKRIHINVGEKTMSIIFKKFMQVLQIFRKYAN